MTMIPNLASEVVPAANSAFWPCFEDQRNPSLRLRRRSRAILPPTMRRTPTFTGHGRDRAPLGSRRLRRARDDPFGLITVDTAAMPASWRRFLSPKF